MIVPDPVLAKKYLLSLIVCGPQPLVQMRSATLSNDVLRRTQGSSGGPEQTFKMPVSNGTRKERLVDLGRGFFVCTALGSAKFSILL